MPKFETINTTLQDGAQFDKFLKYLPFQNFIKDDLEIVEVFESKGKEIVQLDKKEWVEKLKSAISGIGEVEQTLADKYEEEKQRNDELQERLEKLEKLLNQPKELPKIKADVKSDELEGARRLYSEKTGKKPYHGWDVETLKQKINE